MFDIENKHPRIIGIAGGTGSGKTTVAQQIANRMPAASSVLIEHDWYYKDQSHRSEAERQTLNFDEPAALDNDLLIEHLKTLKSGGRILAPQYDFTTHQREERTVAIESCSFIIVEGILTFSLPELRDMFDLRLFVDTDDDVRLMRRIKRDIRDRGRDIESIKQQYLSTVRPMHRMHVAPVKDYAHLIIPEGGKNVQALDTIIHSLMQLLELQLNNKKRESRLVLRPLNS